MPRTSPIDGRDASSRRGFTLIEVSISMLLVSVVLVSALYAMGAVARLGRAAVEDDQARQLARALLAEIVQCPFEDPDGSPVFGREFESAANRDGWDDVDDYHGWFSAPPETKDGTPIAGFAGWSRQVDVAYANAGSLATAVTTTGLKRITVIVTDPAGVVTTLEALRSRASPYEQVPALDTEILAYIGVTLTRPGGGGTLVNGVNLRNPVTMGAMTP